MSGIKDEIKKLFLKVQKATESIGKSQAQIDKTKKNLELTRTKVDQMPLTTEKIKASKELDEMEKDLKKLTDRHNTLRKTAHGILETLKKGLKLLGIDVNENQEQVGFVLPVLAVAGLLTAAALLFKQTVNKTREINLKNKALDMVASGKLKSEDVKSFIQENKSSITSGILGSVPKILIGLVVAMFLPQIMSMVKSRS